MNIIFSKISDQEHAVRIVRADNSEDSGVLNSRSFLRHDFAHLAVESEIPIVHGYWGSVANGAPLSGAGISGPDIELAESLAGPVQTLIRMDADQNGFFSIIRQIQPELASQELAARIRERCRRLNGHWKATPYGSEMTLDWDEITVD